MPMPSPAVHTAHQTCRAALHVTRQLLPRSPTELPAPSGQRRCSTYPDTCYKRQAAAVRGGDLDQIARLPTQRTHIRHRRRLSQTQACCCRRDACIPFASHKEHAAGMLAGSPESAGRGRSERESRVGSAGRAVTIRMRKGWMGMLAHTAGSYRCASRARLRLHGAVSVAA